MRILHLISSVGLFGAERVILELSKSLKREYNCRPVVGVIKNSYNPHVEIADEAERIGLENVSFVSHSQFDFRIVPVIKEFIDKNRIDIVHCHGYKSNLYGLLASKNKVPIVTTNHNWLRSHWKLKIYCFFDSLWIRFFDQIVAVSHNVKNDMMKHMISESRIMVIDNGIDLRRFNETKVSEDIMHEFGIKRNSKVVGIIGNLGYEKGHHYLLMAAKDIIENNKSVKVLIIGDGPLRDQLKRESENLGIKANVIFAGYRNDIPDVLSVIDVFVISSVMEGLPMVLLEAMASRTPVVATEVGAIPKVLSNGKNGILIPPGNIPALAAAITELISDNNKAQSFAEEGYRTIEKSFSSELMCRNYYELYKGLAGQS